MTAKVYAINLGRVSYSGIYYNKDLFAANNVEVPTTWGELVAACETFAEANIPCMTAGGKDGWPIFVGAYGLIGSHLPGPGSPGRRPVDGRHHME